MILAMHYSAVAMIEKFGDEATRINVAFEATVAASMPKIPLAIPGTLLWRGIRARRFGTASR